jgi:hemerythrin-like domain-containing protein
LSAARCVQIVRAVVEDCVNPIELLMQEHEVIAKALAMLGTIAERVERDEAVPLGAVLRVVHFLAGFADGHHHLKEERLLFPALVEAGLPAGVGPVAMMLHEHDLGRSLVERLRRAAQRFVHSPAVRREFAEAAREYAALLGSHIHKENQILFRIALQILPSERMAELQSEFAAVESAAAASGSKEAYLRSLDELAAVFLEPKGEAA